MKKRIEQKKIEWSCRWLVDKIEMRFHAIVPSAVVSASASTVGGVPVGREDDAAAAAATADVVVVKLKQPLSPAK